MYKAKVTYTRDSVGNIWVKFGQATTDFGFYELKDLFKRRVRERTYDSFSRCWIVPTSHIEDLNSYFREVSHLVEIVEAKPGALDMEQEHAPELYRALHLMPGAPEELIEAARDALIKRIESTVHHGERIGPRKNNAKNRIDMAADILLGKRSIYEAAKNTHFEIVYGVDE